MKAARRDVPTRIVGRSRKQNPDCKPLLNFPKREFHSVRAPAIRLDRHGGKASGFAPGRQFFFELE
jgi:hypothetical protein